ncbi:MAG: type II secretion system protein [Sedimentisphaerales bacterium]|nr:type II secretion system protein [Sedimentisphaerales bacterium]
MKAKNLGFTMIELLTVISVIAILLALLIPALSMVRRTAKETQQRSQLTTIELAITAFKSDYGDYPPSQERDEDGQIYCGAQSLTEALLGQDLLGYHPDSRFRDDGEDGSGNKLYPKDGEVPDAEYEASLDARRGTYMELQTANAYKLEDLFGSGGTGRLNPERFVICDVFGVKRVTVGKETFKAGTPILYYKAHTESKKMEGDTLQDARESIYNYYENADLIRLGKLPNPDPVNDPHKLDEELFYDEEKYKIIDPKVTKATNRKWPHRPDSYILISAGADSEYGTADDIFNF